MKILKGSAAWIDGKLYKEGQSIPAKNEKEFEKFLVEKEEPNLNPKKDSLKESTKTKSIN